MVRETATLTREDRLQVDAELASRLEGAGDPMVAALARKLTYRLDPSAALRRSQKAENDRRVTIRPAPDTMSNVTGLLPVAQGVALRPCDFAIHCRDGLSARPSTLPSCSPFVT